MEGDLSSSQLSLRDEFSSDLLAKNSFEGRSREFGELRVLLQQWLAAMAHADMDEKEICHRKLLYFIR